MEDKPSVGADLVELYRDLHAHPELSGQEHRTASLAAARLEDAGFEVTTGVGGTGVVGVLSNGDGPAVMLRADMDALPVAEQTGLDYASTQTTTDADGAQVPVMHACGHDMHVTWLVGATAQLAASRDAWSGTVLAVFQPAEETAAGAQGMIDDGLFERFRIPDSIRDSASSSSGRSARAPETSSSSKTRPTWAPRIVAQARICSSWTTGEMKLSPSLPRSCDTRTYPSMTTSLPFDARRRRPLQRQRRTASGGRTTRCGPGHPMELLAILVRPSTASRRPPPSTSLSLLGA